MFFPEAQVSGTWDIQENTKGNTIVDKKNLSASATTDLTPMFVTGQNWFECITLVAEVVDVLGTECDMSHPTCKLVNKENYSLGLCEHKTYMVRLFRGTGGSRTWQYRNFLSFLKKQPFGVQVVSELECDAYDIEVKLYSYAPTEVITLQRLRNVMAYLDLQKDMPNIRSYVDFSKLDWDSTYSLIRQLHTKKYWWYKYDHLNTGITNVARLILAQKVAKALLSDDYQEAIVHLYYEFLNSVVPISVLDQYIRDCRSGKEHIPLENMTTGEIDKVTIHHYINAFSPLAYGKVKHQVDDRLEILSMLMRDALYAARKLEEGMTKYGKLTTPRLKQVAKILSQGIDYAKSEARKEVSNTSMRNYDAMSKFMDEDTAKAIAETFANKQQIKAMHDFRLFDQQHSRSNNYQHLLGNIPKEDMVDSTGNYRWGDLAVIQEPLTKNLKHKLKGSIYKPNEYGVIPHYPDRFLSDKRLFRVKKNIKGGTVLIDTSGSMSLSEEQVFEIIEALPAGVVAMYSGTSRPESRYHSRPRGDGDGELCILAKNQRMVSKLPESFGENIVDYPALVWLSKMPRPRIWVSDQHVTMLKTIGEGESAVHYGKEQCLDLVKRAGIITLEDVDDVVEFSKLHKKQ